MIVNRESLPRKLTIDLSGPDGNAFALIGVARDLAKMVGLNGKETSAITEEMMNGDYDHLIETLEDNFGEFIILIKD